MADDNDTKRWGHNPDTWMVLLTGILMLIGVGTALIFYRQFQEMSNQTKILNGQAQQSAVDSADAAKRAEKQLAIAQKQAKAAQDSADAIQEQTKVDERARIEIFSVKPEDISVGSPLGVPFNYINRGKTPAEKVFVLVVVEKVKNGEAPHFAYESCHRLLHSAVGYLPTGRPIQTTTALYHTWEGGQCEFHQSLSQADHDDLISGNAFLATYAYMTYQDIFKIKHWLKYCAWSGFKQNDVSVRHTAGTCIAYNDEDSL